MNFHLKLEIGAGDFRKLVVERKDILFFSPSALKFPICYTLGRWNGVIEKWAEV